MSMQNVYGSVSIHRLRTGATVQLYLSVTRGLYQLVSPDGTCQPDWSQTDNQPTITPHVIPVGAMSEPKWYCDGNRITTGADYRIGSDGSLTFLKSPVDPNNVHNLNYTFKCKVTTGGTASDIERTIQVLCHAGGENSYWGNINADQGTTLGKILEGNAEKEINEITLTPTLWCGSSKKTFGTDYHVVWKRTGTGAGGADEEITSTWNKDAAHGGCKLGSNGSLIVTREGVNSVAHFECHFFNTTDTVELEAEGITIADNQDEYFINISGDKNVQTGSGNLVRLQAAVYSNRTNTQVPCSNWQVVVTDSERMNEYTPANNYGIGIDNSGNFSMSESNMFVPNTGSKKADGKPWLKIGDDASKDVAVATQAEATECDINVQFVATL